MSHIVIDGRMLGWTGIGRYTRSLLEELERIDSNNRYTVLVQRQDWERWAPTRPNFERLETNIPPYSFGEQWRLPWVLYRQRADLVHFLNFNSPLLYLKKRVVTIHDLTLLDFKNYRGSGWLKLVYELKYRAMRLVFWRAVRGATRVITDVHYNRELLATRGYAPTAKTTAIPLGMPDLPAAPSGTASSYPKPYLLYVGNLYPYKNLVGVVEALPQLLRLHPNLRFVIVGKEDVFSAGLRQRARELKVGTAVVFTGFVSDAELAAYYHGAVAYVFPSLSEGFGLPGLEAMGYGLPVAAADASCLPEVYGDAAVYFDPHSPADIARVVGDLLNNSRQRTALKARGLAHVKTFSWQRMATQTLAVYQQALKPRR